jgi:hypothetical protein
LDKLKKLKVKYKRLNIYIRKMSGKYHYSCEFGCGRDNVVSAEGNCCGREDCKKNWYEANSIAGKYKYYVLKWIKEKGPGIVTKQAIKQGIIALGYATGLAATLVANIIYYGLKPSEAY